MKIRMRLIIFMLIALCFTGCEKHNDKVNSVEYERVETMEDNLSEEISQHSESNALKETTTLIQEMEISDEKDVSSDVITNLIAKIKNSEIESGSDEVFENIEEYYITSSNYKLFEGNWNRTDCESSFEGNIEINNCDENEINISGYFTSYANSGEFYLTGRFITDYDVIAFEEDGAVYLFSYTDEAIEVYQIGIGMYMGGGTSADGKYILGEPEYTNDNQLATLFSEEDLESIHQLFVNANADEELYFILPFTEGIYDMEEGVAQFENTSDAMEGTWMQAFIPHLGEGYTDIFISKDHKIFIRFNNQSLSTEENIIIWNHEF